MPDPDSSQVPDFDLSFSISRAEAIVMRVPCPVPVRTSFGTMYDRPAVFLQLEDSEGNKGLGEVWCNFPACGAEHRARLLETAIFPALFGMAFDTPAHCFASLENQFARLGIQSGEPGPIAQSISGVDVALWDLVARRARMPLFRLLGGYQSMISVYASGINPANATETVERCRSEGHSAFKLKIGFDRQGDLKNIEQITSSLEEGEAFMVDANQAWTLGEALETLPDLTNFSLGWLEEPLMADRPAREWQGLATASAIPLAAGENMINAQDFDQAIAGDWFGVVQPDLCKWGGISGVLPVARSIIGSGKRYCPHYLGGGIGLAASAHLLAAVGGDGLLEMDSNDNPLRGDLFSPRITSGKITLDDKPGLGIADQFEALMNSGVGRVATK